jgi:adenine phosphoribosyltransferase
MPAGELSMTAARDVVLDRFAWVDGHADVWAVFRDANALRLVVQALVEPFVDEGITAVCGIESRGFLLGGAAAIQLGVGFVPIRKSGGLLPGAKSVRTSAPDYRGLTHTLRLQRSALAPGDRLILVDDWIETGSQFRAAREIVNDCGASLIGYSVIVDDLADQQRADSGRGHALLRANELPVPQSQSRQGSPRFRAEPGA